MTQCLLGRTIAIYAIVQLAARRILEKKILVLNRLVIKFGKRKLSRRQTGSQDGGYWPEKLPLNEPIAACVAGLFAGPGQSTGLG